jgi:zinc transport system ATP-binding protein
MTEQQSQSQSLTSPALEISNLWVEFRGQTVLEDVSLVLERGGFLGVIGPNGAGKSVLLKTIAGLIAPTRGEVRVFGRPISDARGLIGYVPQFGGFDHEFPISVRDVVLMGRLARRGLLRRYSSADVDFAKRTLGKVGMLDAAERAVGKLSGGQLQRVLIARALAAEPQLLLLDEPTASLDTSVGRDFYELLDELSKEATIIMVSHDVGVIAQHVKTIACLNRRIHYHHSRELSGDMLEQVYGCPVDLIAHGHAHRVLGAHDGHSD